MAPSDRIRTPQLARIGVTRHRVILRNAIEFVCQSITNVLLARSFPITSVSSLAVGADQIFADLILEQGGSLHAVIPCDRYEETFERPAARHGYLRLLGLASERKTLPYSNTSEEAFLAAGKGVVDLSELIIAVWDGKAARGQGGTADIVAYARVASKDVVIAWPRNVER